MNNIPIYGVIMAGGRGRRLWPLSTPSRPKQFIEVNGESLLSRTFDRISPLISPENVLVVTNKGKGEMVQEELPELPGDNIIEEPMGKNTAPCIGLSAVYSHKILDLDDDNSVMVVLPADHLVKRGKRFRELIKQASEVAFEGNKFVTLGIKPTEPATGYGYIKAGERLESGEEARKAESFTEKPDRQTAEEFLAAGNYYWNSGTFIWRTDRLLQGLKKNMNELYRGLERIERVLGSERADEITQEEYSKFSGTSIDYGLMENVGPDERAVIPASVGWSDLGDWPSFEQLIGSDEDGNSCYGDVMCDSSKKNIIFNDGQKPVVTLGLSDLVVVNTSESVLVMEKERAQEVKRLAKEFERRNK